MVRGAVRRALAAAWGALGVLAWGNDAANEAAERAGLLLGCGFRDRAEFFRCCGRAVALRGGLVAPELGCFPHVDAEVQGRRQEISADDEWLPVPGGSPPHALGAYRRSYARCCEGVLRRHRRLSADGEVPAWSIENDTLMNPRPYPGVARGRVIFELVSATVQDLGAAVLAEPLGSVLEGMRLFELPHRTTALAFSRLQYGFGSAQLDGVVAAEGFLPVFERLKRAGHAMSSAFLDVGAADGSHPQSPLWSFQHLQRQRGEPLAGLAFEANRSLCARYRRAWPGVRVSCGVLTAELAYELEVRAPELEAVCRGKGPRCVDVWKVDIDGIDCTVLEVWLRKSRPSMRPKVVIAEVNSHFPPPYRFSIVRLPPEGPRAAEARIARGLFGCSLSHQVAMLRSLGYWLLEFLHKDAVYVHRDFAGSLGLSAPADEFESFMRAQIMIWATSPYQLRQWMAAPPHVGLAEIQDFASEAEGRLRGAVRYSLGL